MARVSFNPADASAGGYGIQEGNVEIVAAVSKVHQYPPNAKTGKQSEPFVCIQLALRKLDDDYDPIPDEAEEHVEYSIGKSVMTDQGLQAKFHPGKAKNADDEDPEDMGTEIDVEGNTLVAVDGAATLNKNTKWIRFTDSLTKCGFKPEVLGRGWLPDLIGTKGHVMTFTLPKIPGSTSERDSTVLLFDKIVERPYEKKAGGKGAGAGAGKAAGAAPAKTPAKKEAAPAPAPAPPPASAPATGDDFTATAGEVVTAVAAEKSGTQISLTRLTTSCQMYLMKNQKKYPVSTHKSVLSTIKNLEWLEAFGGESMLFVVDTDSGEVAFS